MINLNFEFDSKDALSSQFFNWLSAFPLNQSSLKITTSVDVSDSKTNETHRIGNIILDIGPGTAAKAATLSGKSHAQTPVIKEKASLRDKAEDRSEAKTGKTAKAGKPARAVFSRFAAKSKPSVVKDQKDQPAESVFDASIFEAVAFEEEMIADEICQDHVQTDEVEPAATVDSTVTEPHVSETVVESEKESELKVTVESEETVKPEETEPVENPSTHFADNNPAEDFDFLLNSLDEFNA